MEELRIRAFLTQAALAARSGVSQDTISKLETGERASAHGKTVAKLAEALSVEPWELRDRVPQPDDSSGIEREGDKGVGASPSRNRRRGRPGTRNVELAVTELERQAALYAFWQAMEMLPENTPEEAIATLEWVALVFQGHAYEEARAKAEERERKSEPDVEADDGGDEEVRLTSIERTDRGGRGEDR